MKSKIIILTPVYNDWKNLEKLLKKINKIFEKNLKKVFELIIVNDRSKENFNFKKYKLKMIKKIRIISLDQNIGSQRAIAIGIKYINNIYKNEKFKTIIIDSDGQDNPKIIPKMLFLSEKKPKFSIAVNRGQRKEELWFRIFYEIYCFTIRIFYFKKIRFGNFSLLNSKHLRILSNQNELWSAFPPTLSKHVPNLIHLTSNREKRYSGVSKMNFFGLIKHALRVFSALKQRVILSSVFYLILFYIISNHINELFFFIVTLILILFNSLIFFQSFDNKKKFLKNFKKAKIKTL